MTRLALILAVFALSGCVETIITSPIALVVMATGRQAGVRP